MSVGSILGTGLEGINRGLQGMQRNAEAITQMGSGPEDQVDHANTGDLAKEMVEMKQNELQVKASANVIKSVDETIGTLLDIRA